MTQLYCCRPNGHLWQMSQVSTSTEPLYAWEQGMSWFCRRFGPNGPRFGENPRRSANRRAPCAERGRANCHEWPEELTRQRRTQRTRKLPHSTLRDTPPVTRRQVKRPKSRTRCRTLPPPSLSRPRSCFNNNATSTRTTDLSERTRQHVKLHGKG